MTDSHPPDQTPEASESTRPDRRRRRTPLVLRLARWLIVLAIVFAVLSISGCLERLAYMPSGSPPPPPAGAEEVRFASADGTRLHGWFFAATGMTAPDSNETSVAPTILVVHGNAGNIDTHHPFVEYLPGAGFNMLLFDYRGYGHSEKGRLRRDNLRADTEAALDYLLNRPDLANSPILMYAQSIGATFGLSVMAERDEVQAAVIMSSFTRWQDIAASAIGGRKPGVIARFFARSLMPAGLEPIDSIQAVGDRPILYIHGTDDEVIPYAHGEAMVKAARDAGVPITFRTVQQGDHNSLRWIDTRLDGEIIEFYRSAIEPDAP